jgi:phenylacetate-coenzyme A ligase PaaK-like adenylate-forming protein
MPLAELVSQLNKYQPSLMQGYASTVSLLAEEQVAGRLRINPVLVLPTSEGLTDRVYEKIARAFNARVGTFYGGTECGAIAWSCEYQWLHINSDWAIIEPVDADFQPVPAGVQSHTVLVSNLANRVQPILRYDMGDSILVRPDQCACGNPLPAIRVQGRVADILTFSSQNGAQTKITALQFGVLFDRTPGVQLFQVIQTTPTTLRVRLRTAEDLNQDQIWQSIQREITGLLKEYKLGHVQVERATELPEQAEGGKYRQIIPLG